MRRRHGIALLESLVALVTLAVFAPAAIRMLRGALDTQGQVARHAERLMQADRLLQSVSLWSRAELDRHLGQRRQGDWVLEVQRRPDGLYDVIVREGGARGREWLRTSVPGGDA